MSVDNKMHESHALLEYSGVHRLSFGFSVGSLFEIKLYYGIGNFSISDLYISSEIFSSLLLRVVPSPPK